VAVRRPTRSSPFPYTMLFRSFALLRAEVSVHGVRELLDQNRDAFGAPLAVPERHVHGDALGRSPVAEEDLHRVADIALVGRVILDRKSTRLNSSHVKISYAVF